MQETLANTRDKEPDVDTEAIAHVQAECEDLDELTGIPAFELFDGWFCLCQFKLCVRACARVRDV